MGKMMSVLLIPGVIAQANVLPLLSICRSLFAVTLQVLLPKLFEFCHRQLDGVLIADELAIGINHVVLSAGRIVQVKRSIVAAMRHVRLCTERLT